MRSQEIYDQHSEYGVTQGGELYLDPARALDFVTACNDNDLAIIGIEGFLYEQGTIVPQLDMIADFSSTKASNWQEYRTKCNRDAAAFLQRLTRSDNIVCSFVVVSQEEWTG